jgi:hypothetical protein
MPVKELVTGLLGKGLTATEIEIMKQHNGDIHGMVAKPGVLYSLEKVHSRFESGWAAEI